MIAVNIPDAVETQAAENESNLLPVGVWPVAITPFHDDGTIDWKAYDQLIDWYVENGSAGIYSVCLSSEFYHLTQEERLKLGEITVKRCKGKIPVVTSGGLGNNLKESVESVKTAADTGVASVVIPLNQLVAPDDSDEKLLQQLDLLLNLTGDIKLGLYECPSPYRRGVNPGIMRFCAMSERFNFMKDTCCNVDEIGFKAVACKDSNISIFNANINTLVRSMNIGSRGYNGVAANFYPDLIGALLKCHQTAPEKAAMIEKVVLAGQRNATSKYLPNAKAFLSMSGVKMSTRCRTESPELTKEDMECLEAFHFLIEYWRRELL